MIFKYNIVCRCHLKSTSKKEIGNEDKDSSPYWKYFRRSFFSFYRQQYIWKNPRYMLVPQVNGSKLASCRIARVCCRRRFLANISEPGLSLAPSLILLRAPVSLAPLGNRPKTFTPLRQSHTRPDGNVRGLLPEGNGNPISLVYHSSSVRFLDRMDIIIITKLCLSDTNEAGPWKLILLLLLLLLLILLFTKRKCS